MNYLCYGPFLCRIIFCFNTENKINKLTHLIFILLEYRQSVPMEWSVDSLPGNHKPQFRFPAGSEIFIYILGLGVCPLFSVLCCLWR